jgi:purine-cytosine permease-like protein
MAHYRTGHQQNDSLIVGMVETYYVGALAAKIGADGGDIANKLALVFRTVSHLPLRTLELKYVGR